MGTYHRDRLPDVESYFDSEGLRLVGRGQWRTTECPFHGGSDSMRVNVRTGGWICMNCQAKGGDVLEFHKQRHGLDFVSAAKALGAYEDDGKAYQYTDKPRQFTAREALELAALEMGVCHVVLSDAQQGTTPSAADWRRFLDAVGRVEYLAAEFA